MSSAHSLNTLPSPLSLATSVFVVNKLSLCLTLAGERIRDVKSDRLLQTFNLSTYLFTLTSSSIVEVALSYTGIDALYVPSSSFF